MEETGIPSREIDDVKVMEDFSFVTVPEAQAETILRTFKSLASRAKADRGASSSRGGRNFGNRSGDRGGRDFGNRGGNRGGDRGFRNDSRKDDRPRSFNNDR